MRGSTPKPMIKNFDFEFFLNISNWKFVSYIFKPSLGTYAPLHSITKIYICLFYLKVVYYNFSATKGKTLFFHIFL